MLVRMIHLVGGTVKQVIALIQRKITRGGKEKVKENDYEKHLHFNVQGTGLFV